MRRYAYRVGIWLARIYWFVFRPASSGVKCVVSRGNTVLFVRHAYGNGRWTFPGGGIKKGENPAVAVSRELEEELGLSVADVRRIGTVRSTAEYKRDTVLVFAANAERDIGSIDRSEIADAGWHDPLYPPEPLGDIAREALKLWFAADQPAGSSMDRQSARLP